MSKSGRDMFSYAVWAVLVALAITAAVFVFIGTLERG